MLLGVVYILIAATCTELIDQGWSEWLYLAFFWALWNGLKFLLFSGRGASSSWRRCERGKRSHVGGSIDMLHAPNTLRCDTRPWRVVGHRSCSASRQALRHC